VSRLRIWPFNKAQRGIPASSMSWLDRAGISSRKTITKIILMMCNGWNFFKNFALPTASAKSRRREKKRKRERERERENVRSSHSSTVSELHERGPLSIGWLLRRPLLISSPLVLYCSLYFSPPLFLFRVLLANLTISSSIDLPESLAEFLLFFTSIPLPFFSSHQIVLTRRSQLVDEWDMIQ